MDDEGQDYIQAYNSKVKHNESTIDMAPPTKLKLVRRNGSKLTSSLKPHEEEKKDEEESSDSEADEPTKKTDRKKIRFNLKPIDTKN